MLCKKCNNEIPEDSVFCPICGEKVKKKLRNPWIIVAVVFAIVSVVLGVCVVALIHDEQMTDREWQRVNGNLERRYEDLVERYDKLLEENWSMSEKIDFYYDHAAIVGENEEIYHRYNCEDFDAELFLILNTEQADHLGYTPCKKCH